MGGLALTLDFGQSTYLEQVLSRCRLQQGVDYAVDFIKGGHLEPGKDNWLTRECRVSLHLQFVVPEQAHTI